MGNRKEFTEIKVISFDGDMTLWDFQSAMKKALQLILKELREKIPGPATDSLTIAKLMEIRNQTAQELKGNLLNLEEIRYHAFNRTLAYLGEKDDLFAAHLYNLYMKHRYEAIKTYPDVIPTLHALRKKYKLGMISNGNTDPERCGLANIFTFTLFAQHIGIEKPDTFQDQDHS